MVINWKKIVIIYELNCHHLIAGLLLKEKRDHPDEETYQYAKFCSSRVETLKGKKDYELCHMCFFQNGCSKRVRKTEVGLPLLFLSSLIGFLNCACAKCLIFNSAQMGNHCYNVHRNKGFLCDKTGCVVRAATLGEVGLHQHYLHGQSSRGIFSLSCSCLLSHFTSYFRLISSNVLFR